MYQMQEVVKRNYEYLSYQVHSDDFEQIDQRRRQVIDQVRLAQKTIAEMPPLENDTQLRDESIVVLGTYERAFDLDYGEVLNLKRSSKNSYEAMAAYFAAEDKAEAKLTEATLKLQQIQRVYASKNNMRVGGTDSVQQRLETKMKRAQEVNRYWRAIFLEYFRAATLYERAFELMEQKHPHNLERVRKELLKASQESVPKLRQMPAFHGNTSFRDIAADFLAYFERIANEQLVKIVGLFQKPRLTQADVDEVNSVIQYCNSMYELQVYNLNNASQVLFEDNIVPQP